MLLTRSVSFTVEGVFLLIHAVSTDPIGRLITESTVPRQGFVATQDAQRFPSDSTFPLPDCAQLQLGGGAEVVSVMKARFNIHYVFKLDVHGALGGISQGRAPTVREYIVGRPLDIEGAQVATAFQPDLAQKSVQLRQRSLCLHLHVEPEERGVGVLYPQMKEARRPAPRVFVVGGAALEMAGHRRLGGALAAEGTPSVGSEPGHVDHSIAKLEPVLCRVSD